MRPILRRAALAALAVLVAAGAAVVGPRAPEAGSALESPALVAGYSFRPVRTVRLSASAVRSAVELDWWGGTYVTTTGEPVTLLVADAYPVDESVARAWAGFFAGLVHGAELRSLRVHVAPLEWVEEICGRGASGCYGDSEMFVPGETVGGVSPSTVAAHEYGHHVAANRSNAPWSALDWGTKRWASGANVCARTAAGYLFPGNEDGNYRLNPGEAFAEAYRVLNEKRSGAASFEWPLVDPSFLPDSAALARVEEDVLRPWTTPTTRTYSLRFSPRTSRSWSVRLATPRDGDLRATLRLPAGAGHSLTLLSADGDQVLARGRWAGVDSRTLGYRVCGHRSLVLRVTRNGRPGRFSVQVSRP
jgi:hypothetical protein